MVQQQREDCKRSAKNRQKGQGDSRQGGLVWKPMAAAGIKRPCVERFDFGLDLRTAKPWVLAGPLDTRHIVMTSGVEIRAYRLYHAS